VVGGDGSGGGGMKTTLELLTTTCDSNILCNPRLCHTPQLAISCEH
jgi:hypothetical protein